MRNWLGVLYLLTLLMCHPAIATEATRSPKEIDDQLAAMIKTVSTLGSADSVDYDKLSGANKKLMSYLKEISVQTALMNYPFKAATNAGLTVLTSEDKKVRCISWDTSMGGTMHIFWSLIAFNAGHDRLNLVTSAAESLEGGEGPGSMFEALYTISTKAGKTVYLIQDLSIASSLIYGRSIEGRTIDNGKFSVYPMFKTPKKLLDSISYSFGESGPNSAITLSKDKKTLKIPVIVEDKNGSSGGKATGKFLTYCFDGNRFVFTK